MTEKTIQEQAEKLKLRVLRNNSIYFIEHANGESLFTTAFPSRVMEWLDAYSVARSSTIEEVTAVINRNRAESVDPWEKRLFDDLASEILSLKAK